MTNIFMRFSWGSEDPKRAAMVFEQGNALAKARGLNGEEVVAVGTIPGSPVSFVRN
ncbi:MAG: hypothetical protein BMS9Abin26_1575 [Gammaproteobacteria bacterium]|nr:MAG: hypothetical protein BMS9Abin26_1575 [Gammaproteobacteria bacterium]